ncbi:hypothetical protein [Paracoccus albus]|uniref:hypothetical protein n=1 Tax=Paracoccus albus TaxID=3017784 RepID=UPI0022EFDA0D|nr:hypothetical protein [Paracoccus albus]WBU60911.1 hypothetical protein PAF20_03030 [Paracoccus albus]
MSNRHFWRRRAILAAAATMLSTTAALGFEMTGPAANPNLLRVLKDPGCGCCDAWADLAIRAGFEVQMTETDDYVGMQRDAAVLDNEYESDVPGFGDVMNDAAKIAVLAYIKLTWPARGSEIQSRITKESAS